MEMANFDDLYDPEAIYADSVDPILEDDDLLASVAGLAESIVPLRALIKNRVTALSRQIIFGIPPAQLPLYRQGILELDTLLSDVEKYEEEYRKRQKPKEGDQTQPTNDAQASESGL